MPYNFGSSSININTGIGPVGPAGPTSGITGSPGPTGTTGNTGDGLTGPTGIGVISIAIIGTTLGITYGTGNTLFSLSNSSIKGPTGTTYSNTTQYVIKGITTNGFSVLKTTNARDFAANSITYGISGGVALPNTTVNFRPLIFSGITYTDTNIITLTGVDASQATLAIKTNQLIYIDNNLLAGVTTAFWDNTNRTLTYRPPVFLETNTINFGITGDNYRNSLSEMSAIPATGCNILYTLARPLTHFSSATGGFTGGLYLDGISGSVTNTGVFLEFGQSSNENYGYTFGPQYAAAITYGSCCLPSGKCIEYSTQQYCNTFSGSTFSPETSCEVSKCGFKSCCLYDIETDGFTCIDTHPSECAAFLGVTGTSMCDSNTCISSSLCCIPSSATTMRSTMLSNSDFENQYATNGRCCFGGKCYYVKTKMILPEPLIPIISAGPPVLEGVPRRPPAGFGATGDHVPLGCTCKQKISVTPPPAEWFSPGNPPSSGTKKRDVCVKIDCNGVCLVLQVVDKWISRACNCSETTGNCEVPPGDFAAPKDPVSPPGVKCGWPINYGQRKYGFRHRSYRWLPCNGNTPIWPEGEVVPQTAAAKYIPTFNELVFVGYDTCGSFIGACCTVDDCYNTTSIECEDLQGTFKGAGVNCSEGCTS